MPKSTAYQARDLKVSMCRTDLPVTERSNSWLCLAIAAVLLLFSNGANTIALAAWLSPVFMLRFVRRQRSYLGLPIAYILFVATFSFQFRGMVPIPGIGYYIFLVAWGVSLVLPYILDRFIARRLTGLASSLVFPASWVVTEYALSQAPYGTWGSAAYSQYGNLALLQLVSVTGLWGITFLIGWFAAVCNWVWEDGLYFAPARRGAWLCAGTIVSVTLLGGARLALFPPSSPTVRVASLSSREVAPKPDPAIIGRVWAGNATASDKTTFRAWSAATNQDLMTRAEQEMQAGAKIVFWGEINGQVMKGDEAAFVARGEDLASKYHAYLGMALAVLNQGKTPAVENKFVLIRPDGRVAWEYNKARPIPGPDASQQIRGDGRLRALDTPYGRVSSIICFDGDYPQLLAQAGTLKVDMILDPSNDWRAIDPWHTQMASFRAIEQGTNLIRQTSKGFSATFDYQGRRLATMDYFRTSDFAMVSQIPNRGVRTIYSHLGDWFAWLCIAGLLVLVIISLTKVRPT
ncbi:nitrilase-related carbon-nitrogen hydrolase [Granulicella sp. L56]|uniref:nitrilase-related carbon-nitrogen hydrolase n=1 Tax=Granulicella sp. L56 TaxID=1747222 RepID=UPI00131BD80C|nr:nitrilase-related carbon-nitrogen hydrolase [Granulicella sp. L56]